MHAAVSLEADYIYIGNWFLNHLFLQTYYHNYFRSRINEWKCETLPIAKYVLHMQANDGDGRRRSEGKQRLNPPNRTK